MCCDGHLNSSRPDAGTKEAKLVHHRRLASRLGAIAIAAYAFSATSAHSASPWADDIAYYRSTVFEPDASYSPSERQKGESLLADLERSYQGMSNARIELALAEISALTDNGHSFLMPGGWTIRYPQLPIRFWIFVDGVFVIAADEAHANLVGRRLVSIHGHSTEEIREGWARYQGGLGGWRDQYLPYFLQTPAMLKAAGFTPSESSITLSLSDPEGNIGKHQLDAAGDPPTLEGMELYIAPSGLLAEAGTFNPDMLPLYLQQPDQVYRLVEFPDVDAVFIQFKANTDFSGEEDIGPFLQTVTGRLAEAAPAYVIVDQRFNFGGDLTTTRELMKAIPSYLVPGGKVYIITSGRTFSAGISSVAYLKQAAGDRAVIVGEPVGDKLEFWSEGDLHELPNSGVAFLMATERHNYMTGCPEPDCHDNIRRDPIRVQSVAPDVYAPLGYSDYQNGVDPSMKAIRKLITSDS